jgi:hypothetical protein
MFSDDPGLCVSAWKNPSRTLGCKWSLLNIKEKEIQREYDGVQVESSGRERRVCFSFSGAFKTYSNPWGGQTQEIPT